MKKPRLPRKEKKKLLKNGGIRGVAIYLSKVGKLNPLSKYTGNVKMPLTMLTESTCSVKNETYNWGIEK